MNLKQIKMLTIISSILIIGASIIISTPVTACHSKTISISPSSSQDVTEDAPNNWVQYDITCHLSPGCSSHYYVAFTVDEAPPGWLRALTNDNGQDIIRPSAPTGPDVESYNWIDINSVSTYTVHLNVSAPAWAENSDQAVITVNCWSTDSVENDLENDPITTTTTVNIPSGIRLYPKHSLLMSQDAYPGESREVEFVIKDIGCASGYIDLFKDQSTNVQPDGGGDWSNWGTEGKDYNFNPNPVNLPEDNITETKLIICVPPTAKHGDKLFFVARGVSQTNTTYTHTTNFYVNIIEDLPDLKITNVDLKINPSSPYENEDAWVNITIHNNGEKDVADFEVELTIEEKYFKILTKKKTITQSLSKKGGIINVSFIWPGKEVYERDFLVYIEVDKPSEAYPNGMIMETYENNNLAGKEVTVKPPRDKWIEATIELDTDVCEPSGSILVKGKATYNSEFNFAPVKYAKVTLEIMDTNISEQILTDNNGNYEKKLSAPSTCKKYKVIVDIQDNENVGLKNGEKLEIIFEVVSLTVSVDINPTYCLGYDSVQVYGKVKNPIYEVHQAKVDIKIEGLEDSWFEFTDRDGIYSKIITAPTPTLPTIYIINVTAEKDEITGCNSAWFKVDIDSDEDGIGNDLDADNDNDGYFDEVDDFPDDPKEWIDSDMDSIGNNADKDDDNDDYSDENDSFPFNPNEWHDTDCDGIGNNEDLDDDNDLYLDDNDTFPLDQKEWLDTDNDTIGNNADDDNDGYSDENDTFPTDPYEWIDTDGDGIGNNADPDDDNDGFTDESEINAGTDPLIKDDYPIEEKAKTEYYFVNIIFVIIFIVIFFIILYLVLNRGKENNAEVTDKKKKDKRIRKKKGVTLKGEIKEERVKYREK